MVGPLLRQRGSVKILRSRPRWPGFAAVPSRARRTSWSVAVTMTARVDAFREQDAGGGEERRLIITLVRPGAILSACGIALLVRGSGSAALWLINLQFRQSVTVPGPRGANCV
jgi:hypothetical protein